MTSFRKLTTAMLISVTIGGALVVGSSPIGAAESSHRYMDDDGNCTTICNPEGRNDCPC